MKKRSEMITPVLLGGGLSAYSVALSFREKYGVISHAFMKNKCSVTERSRFVRTHIISGLDDVRVAVPALLRFAAENFGTELFLIPCSELYVSLAIDMSKALRGTYFRIFPDKRVYAALTDRCSLYSMLNRYGIPYPEYLSFDSGSSLSEKKLVSIGFPAVVKPSSSVDHSLSRKGEGDKVYFVRDPQAAERAIKHIFSLGYKGRVILQRKVGEGIHVSVLTTFSGNDGRVVRAVLGRVVSEAENSNCVCKYNAIITKPLDKFAKRLISFLDSIGYVGFASFEILGDGARSYVLELNTTQGMSCDYLRCAGINIAELIVKGCTGEEILASFDYDEAYWHSLPHRTVARHSNSPYIVDASRLYRSGRSYDALKNEYEGVSRRVYVSRKRIDGGLC